MKLMFKTGLFFLFLFTGLQQSHAQTNIDSAQSIVFIRFEYAHLWVGGDLEKRFINSNAVGGSLGYKTRSNWQFGINGAFHFSNQVKVNGLLDDVINEAGDVTDSDGELVKLTYEHRGLSFFVQAAKIFPVFNSNPNSGIITQFGFGYLQHQIKIDYRDGTVFQLDENDLKGYDRLHTGLAFRQFVGYQYFGPKNLMNFYIGFEFQEALTVNRRGYNYDTRSFDTDTKNDLLYGFRFGWIIPFRRRAAEEFYYY